MGAKKTTEALPTVCSCHKILEEAKWCGIEAEMQNSRKEIVKVSANMIARAAKRIPTKI